MNYPYAVLTLTLGKINFKIFYIPVRSLLYQQLPFCFSPLSKQSLIKRVMSVVLQLSL